ncbi:hypothetical protein FEM48_Zijuj09G0216100 [Ziziphus jujuba var. spinosa]|uniref:Uncharacterized protein n=1 Tax=Ziziphus jujuba var. spinosa TaxID=714518 RepID=A0A978UVG1_ZIZJJ|nr:hypothetical protein FEM48_Zijuj09G0216100 [Ziziphus jujuba var. spinosa]
MSGMKSESISIKKGLYDVTHFGLMFTRSTVSNTNSTITTRYVSNLDLFNNHLYGIVPSSIGNLHFLEFLVLSNNKLSGELPSSLKNCTSLASLDLGDNKFSGKLPSWIGETMPNILILHMQTNFFTGDIHSMFCSLANLHILDLSYNSLSSHIPDCIGNLSELQQRHTSGFTVLYPLNRSSLIEREAVSPVFSLVVEDGRVGIVEDATAVVAQISGCEESEEAFLKASHS